MIEDRKRCIAAASLGETGFSYTLSLINGKYKMVVLYTLMEFGVVRFNEMKKYIGAISYKTLSATLPRGISADSAEGRIQPDRARKIPDTDTRRHVRVGREEPPAETRERSIKRSGPREEGRGPGCVGCGVELYRRSFKLSPRRAAARLGVICKFGIRI